MTEKSIMIDMNDPRAGKIAEVISNSTCRKILELLSDKEMNESEISRQLGIPMNTTGYNIKKLIDSGLIEKSKSLWSVKGKKVISYKISNKKIIISPKSSFKGIVPAVLISGLAALVIRAWSFSKEVVSSVVPQSSAAYGKAAASNALDATSSSAGYEIYYNFVNTGYSWLWFLLGALAGLLIFLGWNWRKIW